MKLKKRNQKKKIVKQKKDEKPEENGISRKRLPGKTSTTDPNQETVLETIVNVSRCFAARGVWFFSFCIFISLTNIIVRGRKG
jgi:hypothetical protein